MESIKATVKFKIEYPRAVRSVFLDTREQLSSISYTNLVRLYSQESMHPVVGPWSISGQNWPLTTDRQIHDPLWWPLKLTAHWPPDTWSTLVTMLMTTIIFVVSGQWSVVRRAKKNWPYSPEIFSTNQDENLVLLDDPGRVRSQITSVVCQIQRFDFDCILVVSRKVIIRIPPVLGTNPLYSRVHCYTVSTAIPA